MDIPLKHAMLCWTPGGGVKVVRHPDYDGHSNAYQCSVGACFHYWDTLDRQGQLLQLMIDAWHVVAFNGVPAAFVDEALRVIPEYLDMLADDVRGQERGKWGIPRRPEGQP